MRISKYQILLKIVESGSIKKAAEAVGYTQSAVSQTLKSIEDEFGIQLLIRKRSGLSLTTESEQIMPYIRSICNTENYLQQKIDSLKGIYSGTISIGAYHSVAATILPAMIREFNDLYPNIRFNIYEGDLFSIEEWINEGKIDFGFVALDELSHLQCIPLLNDPMVAIVPSTSEDASLEVFNIEDFNDSSLVTLTEHRDRELYKIFRANNISAQVRYEVEEYETILGMVENELGIGFIPLMAVRENYRVTAIPTEPHYSRSIGIALKDLGRASRAVKAFVDYSEKKYQLR